MDRANDTISRNQINCYYVSNEGAGKGSFLKLMSLMLGSSRVFETTQPSRDVWGYFNGLMTDKF